MLHSSNGRSDVLRRPRAATQTLKLRTLDLAA
jgi:hypothetical protein